MRCLEIETTLAPERATLAGCSCIRLAQICGAVKILDRKTSVWDPELTGALLY
jgi:hypothetical protein